ncbi:hypothetical protein L6X53_RS11665 [Escherichia coli]|nr:hypothetical protein [Escherichia coli]EKG6984918.1 hypothetical protein [Escherichia coli]
MGEITLMAKNEFKPFATGSGANVTTQTDWEALPALLSGFTAGKASSAQVNKAIRQASFIAAALAQYTANKSGLDVLDDGDLNGFISKMGTAFGKDFQALDATLSALAGLATGANKLPYFTGNDTAAQTDLTSVGRDIIGKNTIADILTYLGLGDASGYVGRLLKIQVFYNSGTYTATPGTKKVIVEMVGGGGGGAGARAAGPGQVAVGGAGGAGSYAKAQFTSGFSGVNVMVGSGGMGGTTSNPYASSGGTSSFGNLVSAAGGDSGKPAGPSGSFPFSTVAATVSASPSGSGVIVGTPGEGAASSIVLSAGVSISSPGGSSRFGAGGFITAYGANGIDGAGYGAGGGPVATSTGTPNTALAGGNGSMGIVIVWEYA